MNEYSKRSLSYVTDALPALFGLASRWATRHPAPTSYLAGLWQHDLQRSLLWYCADSFVSEQAQNVARPTQYLAPTWSWASIRRVVDFLDTSYEPVYYAKVLDFGCNVSSTKPFGAVSGGYIKLRGPTLEAKLSVGGSRFWIYVEQRKNSAIIDADCIPESALLGGATVTVRWYSTDVRDLRTGIGFERGIVLLRQGEGEEAKHTRIGLMQYVPTDFLAGFLAGENSDDRLTDGRLEARAIECIVVALATWSETLSFAQSVFDLGRSKQRSPSHCDERCRKKHLSSHSRFPETVVPSQVSDTMKGLEPQDARPAKEPMLSAISNRSMPGCSNVDEKHNAA